MGLLSQGYVRLQSRCHLGLYSNLKAAFSSRLGKTALPSSFTWLAEFISLWSHDEASCWLLAVLGWGWGVGPCSAPRGCLQSLPCGPLNRPSQNTVAYFFKAGKDLGRKSISDASLLSRWSRIQCHGIAGVTPHHLGYIVLVRKKL